MPLEFAAFFVEPQIQQAFVAVDVNPVRAAVLARDDFVARSVDLHLVLILAANFGALYFSVNFELIVKFVVNLPGGIPNRTIDSLGNRVSEKSDAVGDATVRTFIVVPTAVHRVLGQTLSMERRIWTAVADYNVVQLVESGATEGAFGPILLDA